MNIVEKLSEFVEIDRNQFELQREFVNRDPLKNSWYKKFVFDEDDADYNLPDYDAGIYRVMLEHQNPSMLYAGFMYVKVFKNEDIQWYLFSPKLGVFNEPISPIVKVIYFQHID
jgi:hypothetical protein